MKLISKLIKHQSTFMLGMNYEICRDFLMHLKYFSFRSSSTHIYNPQRNVRGNVAAVEPYNHKPQLSSTKTTSPHYQHIIQDLAMTKSLKSQYNNNSSESDETKIARQKQQKQLSEMNDNSNNNSTSSNMSSSSNATDTRSMDHSSSNNQTMPFQPATNSGLNVGSSNLLSHKIISSVLAASINNNHQNSSQSSAENDGNKTNERETSQSGREKDKPTIKPKALLQIPSGNLVVPPRKPFSSVAPTLIASQVPKVHVVTPNNNIQLENDSPRPALPPKPFKNNNNNAGSHQTTSNENENTANENSSLPIKAKPLTIKKQPFLEQPKLRSLSASNKMSLYNTSRRIEMPPAFLFPEIATAELKDNIEDVNGNNVNSPSSIISKLVNGSLILSSSNLSANNNQDNVSVTSADETDKSVVGNLQEEKLNSITESVVRRKRNLIEENAKAKLARRVSFDPLALLLDASLEGELELVRKTCGQVTNPSASNDEGITALHNAICAGHFEIVK
jgi:apoptosis-stimulating of p53 protein 1